MKNVLKGMFAVGLSLTAIAACATPEEKELTGSSEQKLDGTNCRWERIGNQTCAGTPGWEVWGECCDREGGYRSCDMSTSECVPNFDPPPPLPPSGPPGGCWMSEGFCAASCGMTYMFSEFSCTCFCGTQ